MRTPTIQSTGRIAVIIFAAILGLHSMYALAQGDPHPLATPELSSPRETLRNFLALMNNAHHRWKTEGRTYENRAQRAAISLIPNSRLPSESASAITP